MNRSDQHPHASPGNEQRDSSDMPRNWGVPGGRDTAIIGAWHGMEDRCCGIRTLDVSVADVGMVQDEAADALVNLALSAIRDRQSSAGGSGP